jgi:rubrerythrin
MKGEHTMTDYDWHEKIKANGTASLTVTWECPHCDLMGYTEEARELLYWQREKCPYCGGEHRHTEDITLDELAAMLARKG